MSLTHKQVQQLVKQPVQQQNVAPLIVCVSYALCVYVWKFKHKRTLPLFSRLLGKRKWRNKMANTTERKFSTTPTPTRSLVLTQFVLIGTRIKLHPTTSRHEKPTATCPKNPTATVVPSTARPSSVAATRTVQNPQNGAKRWSGTKR